jgi:hypothetical protein
VRDMGGQVIMVVISNHRPYTTDTG